ncbi:MAG: hypothetical protein L6266_02555, partial [Nanoarchaeota archaeon]|nr:hypothetical protein [Nanoarchaeota archaeon]
MVEQNKKLEETIILGSKKILREMDENGKTLDYKFYKIYDGSGLGLMLKIGSACPLIIGYFDSYSNPNKLTDIITGFALYTIGYFMDKRK